MRNSFRARHKTQREVSANCCQSLGEWGRGRRHESRGERGAAPCVIKLRSSAETWPDLGQRSSTRWPLRALLKKSPPWHCLSQPPSFPLEALRTPTHPPTHQKKKTNPNNNKHSGRKNLLKGKKLGNYGNVSERPPTLTEVDKTECRL